MLEWYTGRSRWFHGFINSTGLDGEEGRLSSSDRWWCLVFFFLMFTPITWGNDPTWLIIYVSNGLVQPPTSDFLLYQTNLNFHCSEWSSWAAAMNGRLSLYDKWQHARSKRTGPLSHVWLWGLIFEYWFAGCIELSNWVEHFWLRNGYASKWRLRIFLIFQPYSGKPIWLISFTTN